MTSTCFPFALPICVLDPERARAAVLPSLACLARKILCPSLCVRSVPHAGGDSGPHFSACFETDSGPAGGWYESLAVGCGAGPAPLRRAVAEALPCATSLIGNCFNKDSALARPWRSRGAPPKPLSAHRPHVSFTTGFRSAQIGLCGVDSYGRDFSSAAVREASKLASLR